MSHLEPGLLACFVRSLGRGGGEFLSHLLSCPRCTDDAQRFIAAVPRAHARESLQRELSHLDYNSLWLRITAAGEEAAASRRTSQQAAEPLLHELLGTLPADRLGLLTGETRFREWGLAEKLLDLGQGADSDREAWARLALALAPLLDGRSPSAGILQDFRAAAHTALGDALRQRGDLLAAEVEFGVAGRLLATIVESPERISYCRQLAALRRDQGLFDEAAALLERAAELAEDLGESHLQAEILLELGGLYLDGLGDSPRAVSTFDSALLLGYAGLSPRLAFRIVRGLLRALVADGLVQEALETLAGARRRRVWPSHSVEVLELQALEGRLLLAQGERELEGKLLVAGAFPKLVRRGEFLSAAVAGVALARFCLTEGCGGELVRVVRTIRGFLGEPALDRHVRRALEVFAEEGERGVLSAPSLQLLETYLERAGEWPCPFLREVCPCRSECLVTAGQWTGVGPADGSRETADDGLKPAILSTETP